MDLKDLRVKLFVDGGSVEQLRAMIETGTVSGATSNPSLCAKAGVSDYLSFCREAAEVCGDLPLSLEVVADDAAEIIRQAKVLAAIGPNVYVKVPIVNSLGKLNTGAIRSLVADGIRVNVTACFTYDHVYAAFNSLVSCANPGFISVFAGRLADAGMDPTNTIALAVALTEGTQIRVIWASVRESFNVIQAERCGCHVITVFDTFLKKLHLFGKNLDEFARETSAMFFEDAKSAGYTI